MALLPEAKTQDTRKPLSEIEAVIFWISNVPAGAHICVSVCVHVHATAYILVHVCVSGMRGCVCSSVDECVLVCMCACVCVIVLVCTYV